MWHRLYKSTFLQFQDRWQDIHRSHEEACGDGRAMVDLLSVPVSGGSHTSLTAIIDYSPGRKHCTDLVHEVCTLFDNSRFLLFLLSIYMYAWILLQRKPKAYFACTSWVTSMCSSHWRCNLGQNDETASLIYADSENVSKLCKIEVVKSIPECIHAYCFESCDSLVNVSPDMLMFFINWWIEWGGVWWKPRIANTIHM